MNFLETSRIYLIILLVLAIFLNLIILPYIFYKSHMITLSFKILMIAFCIANVCHNLMDVITVPRTFQSPGLSFYYSEALPPELSKIASSILMAIFCVQIYNEFLHFLYRYLVLCRPKLAAHLTPNNVSILLFASVPLYACAQGYLIWMCADTVSPRIQREIDTELDHLSSQRTAGLVFLFWNTDGSINLHDFLVVGTFLGVNFIFIIGMLVCGIRIHVFIKRSILSAKATAIHATVFRMLIVESVLPLFILHIPAILLMCGPTIFTLPRLVQDVLIELALACPVLEPFTVILFLSRRRTKISVKEGR